MSRSAWAEAHPTGLTPSPDEYIRRCHPSANRRAAGMARPTKDSAWAEAHPTGYGQIVG